ncbi:hypothetical protein BJ742DRAFT_839998 [Cladochytrium replicatum]|nr:hypothetical protein BJ742DRAFT_839998 [Cladochytrium replicatum]
MACSIFLLSAIAVFLLTYVSISAAADPTQLRLLNAFRAANGVPPLAEIVSLDNCAQAHTVDMATHFGKTSHFGSDGSNYAQRITRCTGSGWAGENVAAGYQYVQNVMIAWEGSTDHRKNMLNPDFNVVGFGSYNGYWTQDFAYIDGVKPPQPPAPTTTRPSPSPSPAGAKVTTAASSASPAPSSSATTTTSAEPAEPTYIPPETGVLLDVNSDSLIVPIVDTSRNSTYDNSEGNAAIYAGDEEKLAARSSLIMAKMDENAYQIYLQSKNTSLINPFLVVSFESAGIKSFWMEWTCLALGVALHWLLLSL